MTSLKRKKQASTKSRQSVISAGVAGVNGVAGVGGGINQHDNRTRRRGFGAFHFKSERLVNRLVASVDNDDVTAVQECIDAGVDINSINVLRAACARCSSDVVATLLRGGAMVNRRGEGAQAVDSGPLYLAAKRGSMPIIAVLLSNGANANAKTHSEARTPLHAACVNDHGDCVTLLLNNGADLNSVDIYGCTPLHLAARAGRLNIVDMLLKYGAPADPNDNDGWTPLHLASENGQLTTVRLLLDKGAKINKQNRYGRTPLHWACASNQISIVKLLLEEGADFTIKDSHGNSASSYVTNLRLINHMKVHQHEADRSTIAYTSGVGLLVQIDRRMSSADVDASSTSSVDSGSCLSPIPGVRTHKSYSSENVNMFNRTPGFRRKRREGSITSDIGLLTRRKSSAGLHSLTNSSASRTIDENRCLCSSSSSSHPHHPSCNCGPVSSSSAAASPSSSSSSSASQELAKAAGDLSNIQSRLANYVDVNADELQGIMKFLCTNITRAIDADVRDDQLELLRGTFERLQNAQNLLTDFREECLGGLRNSSAALQSLDRSRRCLDRCSVDDRSGHLMASCFDHSVCEYLASTDKGWEELLNRAPQLSDTTPAIETSPVTTSTPVTNTTPTDESPFSLSHRAVCQWHIRTRSSSIQTGSAQSCPMQKLLMDVERLPGCSDSSGVIMKRMVQLVSKEFTDMPTPHHYDLVSSGLGEDCASFCAHYDCSTAGRYNEQLTPSKRASCSSWLQQLGVKVVSGTAGSKREMRRMSGVAAGSIGIAGSGLDYVKKVAELREKVDSTTSASSTITSANIAGDRISILANERRKSAISVDLERGWNSFACDVALSLIRCRRSDLLSCLFSCSHSVQPRKTSVCSSVNMATVHTTCSTISSERSSPVSFASNSSTPIIGPELFQES